MFSTNPSTGTFTFSNMVAALRASMSATSCGVVTMIAPESDRLHDRQLNVAGAWRQIENQEIEFPPVPLPQKLLGVTRHHRSAQNCRRGVVPEKAHRHQFEVVLLDRHDFVFISGSSPLTCAEHE